VSIQKKLQIPMDYQEIFKATVMEEKRPATFPDTFLFYIDRKAHSNGWEGSVESGMHLAAGEGICQLLAL